jgi:hypothetical protein
MRPRQSAGVILADASEDQAKKSSPIFKKLMKESGHAMGHGNHSMREDLYKGHHITVMTSYQVKIDGKLFKGQLGVSNAGNVHYHGIPNVGFASAIDLVKCVIDVFPDDFPVKKGTGKSTPRMAKKVAKKPAKKKRAAAIAVKGVN